MPMASSSSSLKKHDVFISFRGEDTRSNFTSFLHDALCRNYIETYIDYRIQKGQEVWEELLKAIKSSTLFLVVLSQNYASSTWCLNELVEIMNCNNVVVIPVFYRIEPSHVRKQTGSYGSGLAKHNKKHGKDMIQKWKYALFEVANLSGFDSTTYSTEPDLIEAIIKEVLQKLNHTHTNELRCLFIPDENYSIIESLLNNDSKEVKMIGIWGMGGIGKTTLATSIFQKVSSLYDGSCFLENVTEESKRHGPGYIFNRLLSKLLGKDLGIDTPKVIPSMLMRRLKRMKVFIVLDDVHNLELLENLIGVGHDFLGAGSRVIVTTRDKHVLISGGVHQIHQVKEMSSQNSFLLFNMKAFDKVLPKEGYLELSKRAIDYAKGNPLALKVLGSFLRGKSEIEWNSALAKLKDTPHKEIDGILRWSYNELDDKEKNIFLDIACFFKGFKRGRIIKVLNGCGFFADIGIKRLLELALIRVDLQNHIQMHDLIQEMGKHIVREESPKNHGERSRLWDLKEVCDVLKNNRGTEMVEAIFLDATEFTHVSLSPKAFEKMSNLRLLAFRDNKATVKCVNLPGGLDLLPENLRYIWWDRYPLKSLPSTFCPENLVELSMRESRVEKLWNGELKLPSLEILDLGGSKNLSVCPNMSASPNLKYIELRNCESLAEVDSSIFSLQKLQRLWVRGCTSLKSLSSDTCSPALIDLNAYGCINLQEFSLPLASVERLYLSIAESGAIKLPSSKLHTINLDTFLFPISDSLVDLPENFANCIWLVENPLKGEYDSLITLHKALSSPAFMTLKHLILYGIPFMSEIPDNVSLLSSLETFELSYMAIRCLPETIMYLHRLKNIYVYNCKMLQYIPAFSQFIPFFSLLGCESLKKVLSPRSESEPSHRHKFGFMLSNCIELDPCSYQILLHDALFGIALRVGAIPNSENEDASFYLLPAMAGLEYCFHYTSTQVSFTLELPNNLLGFAQYLVLSPGYMGHVGYVVDIRCECYLDNSSGERIYITSFTTGDFYPSAWLDFDENVYLMSDHMVLWYDPRSCKQIMEAVEEAKIFHDLSLSYIPKVTFRFFIDETPHNQAMILKCGFHWIYPKEDNEVHNRNEDVESDNQEDAVPPTNKLEKSVLELLPVKKYKKQKT